MKLFVILCLVILPGVVRSGVFKCEAANGTVAYQQEECSPAVSQTTMKLEKTDQKKVQLAQEKLNKELQERAALEKERAEQERKNKELQLKEQRALNEQQLLYETQKQTQAIQENTAAVEKQKQTNSFFYGRPYYPDAKPPVIQPPIVQPRSTSKSLSGGISLKLKK
jgi:superfamily II RNA helicase